MKGLKYLIIGSAVLLVILIGALLVIQQANKTRGDLPVLYAVPEFTFTERSGQPFGLDDLKGKISVVDFIFTNCKGPCPMMAVSLGRFYDAFAKTNKVQFVSVSVDPERDSLEVLREYAEAQGVDDNRWVFLRAPKDSVVQLYEQGFKLGGELPYDHATKFVLVDHEGRIRGYYDFDDKISLAHLRTHIVELLKQMP